LQSVSVDSVRSYKTSIEDMSFKARCAENQNRIIGVLLTNARNYFENALNTGQAFKGPTSDFVKDLR